MSEKFFLAFFPLFSFYWHFLHTLFTSPAFLLTASPGSMLNMSVWNPASPNDTCILYLHPNSGNRIDAIRSKAVSLATGLGCSACGFDFAGCGMSEGEYISLGVNEKDDVAMVVSFLLSQGFRRLIIWGRSMGAASATLFLGAYQPLISKYIIAVILDSPFTSFRGIVKAQAKHRKIPQFLRHPAIYLLNCSIKKTCNFELQQITPIAAAKALEPPAFSTIPQDKLCESCSSPCAACVPFAFPILVLSATGDIIVPAEMSGELYESFKTPKIRVVFNGEHNSPRPIEVFRVVVALLAGVIDASSPTSKKTSSADRASGKFLLIYICNFHVLSHLLLIYICKLHWNLNTMFVCQVNSF